MFDVTTSVYSRGYFEHHLRGDLAYAARHGHPLSLVLFCVDHLDDVGRAFGEAASLDVLTGVAKVVQDHIRVEDVLARVSDCEFALLCRGTPAQAASFMATRIRQSVESAVFTHAGTDLPVTISAGVASLPPREAGASDLVGEARAALAQATTGGQNRVVMADLH